ncbi:hypothetical protein AGABI1DRAFT_133450 [Agaricus bisporus var. burnettii JB137-S8]|uniref:Uncharacterized protein n=1 Tax=Agaricus bisporus var. burnettii (strain JB137-S8 / ATCC MYA-4627 / FGSC 10392) TaxID=597362 RepID=K5VIU5_AGABU|nr:uncharacterized protein AGABI1DRAFT_133450 [Agaricus bisporus var. burnettii JB137-S8]EKM74259.1 hypothetical protein AGABI1DRAFT_133450 [Agaricus bisporus var. burnettii JB137-S8]
MTAVAGLMPLHLQLKKLFERSVIRINTLHPHHPVLSLLERRKAKGSTLHPNALERKSKTIRNVIKSPLDSVIDNPSSEIFDPLSEHIKPGHRLVDRHPDKVKFVLMPKNRKDRDEYHNSLNLAPIRESTALHLFTAGVKHKFDPSVPISHQTHSHIALVTAFKGRAITSKTRAAGRRVNEETIVGWSTFLALIKAHKKLQKGWPISKVVLYTTSQLIVKNLMSTNSKPLGSQLSIAVSLAFDAIATDFPEVDIEVRGFNKSWATSPPYSSEESGLLQPLAHRAYYSAENARTFTERSLSFPQSASYHYTRQKTTRDAIQLWQLGFQGVCMPIEPPPHMLSSGIMSSNKPTAMDVDAAGDDSDWSDDKRIPEGMFNSSVGRALLAAARNVEDKLEIPAASRVTTPNPARTTGFPESSLTPLSYTSVPVALDKRSPTPFPLTPTLAPTSTPSTGRSRTLTAGQKGMLKLVNTSIVMLDDIEPEHPLYAPFTDCILRAAHVLIKRRDLDGYKTSSVAGIGSFSEQLAKIIGSVDPPPRAFESTPPPPTPSGTATPRPRSPSADMDMTPRKSKKAKPAQPTPPPPPQPPVFGKDPVLPKNNSYAKAAARRPPQQRPPPRPQAPTAPAAPAPITPAPKPSGKKRRARHTCHGASRRGVFLTPPAGSSIRAAHISPAMLAEINTHLKNDVSSDVILEHAEDSGSGIFVAAS